MGRKKKYGEASKILTIRVPLSRHDEIKKYIEKHIKRNELVLLNDMFANFEGITDYRNLINSFIVVMNKESINEYDESTQSIILRLMNAFYKHLKEELDYNGVIEVEYDSET